MQSQEAQSKNFDKVTANQILANQPRVVYGVGCGDLDSRIERYSPAMEQLKLLEQQFTENMSVVSALENGDASELSKEYFSLVEPIIETQRVIAKSLRSSSSEKKNKWEVHFRASLQKLDKDIKNALMKIMSKEVPMKYIAQVSDPIQSMMKMNLENIFKKHPDLAPETSKENEKLNQANIPPFQQPVPSPVTAEAPMNQGKKKKKKKKVEEPQKIEEMKASEYQKQYAHYPEPPDNKNPADETKVKDIRDLVTRLVGQEGVKDIIDPIMKQGQNTQSFSEFQQHVDDLWEKDKAAVLQPQDLKIDGRCCVLETLIPPVDLGNDWSKSQQELLRLHYKNKNIIKRVIEPSSQVHRYFSKELRRWIYDKYLGFIDGKMAGMTIKEAYQKAKKPLWWDMPQQEMTFNSLFGQVTSTFQTAEEHVFEKFMANRCVSKDFTFPLKQKPYAPDHEFEITVIDAGSGGIESFIDSRDFQQRYRPRVNGYIEKHRRKRSGDTELSKSYKLSTLLSKDVRDKYFKLQFLENIYPGEKASFFVQKSIQSMLICRQLGKCSKNPDRYFRCFCGSNLILQIESKNDQWDASFSDLLVMKHFEFKMKQEKLIDNKFWDQYIADQSKQARLDQETGRKYQDSVDELYGLQMIRTSTSDPGLILMFYMKVLFEHIVQTDDQVQGWRTHIAKVGIDLPEFAALERAAYDSIQFTLENDWGGAGPFGNGKQAKENALIIDWNAAVLALARMYYLFYTGLGPMSEGGNDHLSMHNKFTELLAEEILPDSYLAKDFSLQSEREMQLGSMEDVKKIEHPTYAEISKLPEFEKSLVSYEQLCKVRSPFFTKFQTKEAWDKLKKEKNQMWNGLHEKEKTPEEEKLAQQGIVRDELSGKLRWLGIFSEQIYAFNSESFQQKMKESGHKANYAGLVEKFLVQLGDNTTFTKTDTRGRPSIWAPDLFQKNIHIKVDLKVQLLTMTEFMYRRYFPYDRFQMTHKQEPKTIAPSTTLWFIADNTTLRRNPWYRLIFQMDLGEKSSFWLSPGDGKHKKQLLEFCEENKVKIPMLEQNSTTDHYACADLLNLLPIQFTVSKLQCGSSSNGGMIAQQITNIDAMVKRQFDGQYQYTKTREKFHGRAYWLENDIEIENHITLKVFKQLHKYEAFQKMEYLGQYIIELCNSLLVNEALVVLGELQRLAKTKADEMVVAARAAYCLGLQVLKTPDVLSDQDAHKIVFAIIQAIKVMDHQLTVPDVLSREWITEQEHHIARLTWLLEILEEHPEYSEWIKDDMELKDFRVLLKKFENKSKEEIVSGLALSYFEKSLKYGVLNASMMSKHKLDAKVLESILDSVPPLSTEDGSMQHIRDLPYARWLVPRSEYRKSEDAYRFDLREKCKEMYERKLFPEQMSKSNFKNFDAFFKEVYIEDLTTVRIAFDWVTRTEEQQQTLTEKPVSEKASKQNFDSSQETERMTPSEVAIGEVINIDAIKDEEIQAMVEEKTPMSTEEAPKALSKNQKKNLRRKQNKKAKQDERPETTEPVKQKVVAKAAAKQKDGEEDEDFLQSIAKVSKKTQEALTAPPKKVKPGEEEEEVSVSARQALSLNEYLLTLNQGQKLSKTNRNFVIERVESWQDYVKNIKQGALRFNKRLLSNISAQDICKKCIEVNFDADEYQKWLDSVESWDNFVSEEVQAKPYGINLRKDVDIEQERPKFAEDTDKWQLQQTDGQKHVERIRKLNHVKKNEAFDERYEETREEREERIKEALKRREMRTKMDKEREEQKQKEQEQSNLVKWAGRKVFDESNYEEDKKIEELKQNDLRRRQAWQQFIMGEREAPLQDDDTKEGEMTLYQHLTKQKLERFVHSSEGESYSMTDDSYQSEEASDTPKISKQMQAYSSLPVKDAKKKKSEPFKQQPQFPAWMFQPGGSAKLTEMVDEDMQPQDLIYKATESAKEEKEAEKKVEKSSPEVKQETKKEEKEDKEEEQDYGDEDYYYDEEDYYEDTGYCDWNKHPEKHPLYKTEMCRNIATYGKCTFPKCRFAHSKSELRDPKKQHLYA